MKSFRRELSGFHETLLMDDMMQVVGVDLLGAIDVDGGQSYVKARANCVGCGCKALCRTWLAEHSDEQPQEFCPNAGFFEAVKAGDC